MTNVGSISVHSRGGAIAPLEIPGPRIRQGLSEGCWLSGNSLYRLNRRMVVVRLESQGRGD